MSAMDLQEQRQRKVELVDLRTKLAADVYNAVGGMFHEFRFDAERRELVAQRLQEMAAVQAELDQDWKAA
jgi:hypothetical protein